MEKETKIINIISEYIDNRHSDLKMSITEHIPVDIEENGVVCGFVRMNIQGKSQNSLGVDIYSLSFDISSFDMQDNELNDIDFDFIKETIIKKYEKM